MIGSLWILMLILSTSVFAEAPATSPQAALSPFIPLILIFGIFYFLIIRPQQKKAKLHQQFIAELKRGDMVVTAAGIIGTIKTLADKFVTMEIDEGVVMKILRNQILESANKLKDEPKAKA